MKKQFKDYDRIFAFGCSCTKYFWPTWADIIGTEAKQFYNYGKSGAGNLFISNSIVEANLKHKFTKNDLVLVMWSSISREDRYKDNNWITPGNIFTQGEIPMEFVYKFADSRFYLLRDLGLIATTDTYLSNTNAHYEMLSMTQFIETQITYNNNMIDTWYKDIVELYKPVINRVHKDICTTVYNGVWPTTPIRGHGGKGQTADYHPTPKGYLKYIAKIFSDFEITIAMRNFATEYDKKVLSCKTLDDTQSFWKQQNTHIGRL